MRLNTTGIAARMMLSLDKKAIGEKLINGRQINPTPLQVRYPQGVREVLGIMSEQLAISTADLTRILLEDALHNMFMPADNTWICPYISRHLLSLNPLLACCRRYSRGER